jgi:hypothetical protein
MISILNFVFTVVFYVARWTKLDIACKCFEEFINQLNLLYVCIYLYLQYNMSYRTHELDRGSNFFVRPSLARWNFYIFLYFQFWCCFLYAPLVYVYFELQKIHHHSIILNFVIQFRSIARGYQLVLYYLLLSEMTNSNNYSRKRINNLRTEIWR